MREKSSALLRRPGSNVDDQRVKMSRPPNDALVRPLERGMSEQGWFELFQPAGAAEVWPSIRAIDVLLGKDCVLGGRGEARASADREQLLQSIAEALSGRNGQIRPPGSVEVQVFPNPTEGPKNRSQGLCPPNRGSFHS